MDITLFKKFEADKGGGGSAGDATTQAAIAAKEAEIAAIKAEAAKSAQEAKAAQEALKKLEGTAMQHGKLINGMARVFRGEEDDDDPERNADLALTILNQPSKVLATAINEAVDRATARFQESLKERDEMDAAAKADSRELKTALDVTMKERPDISQNDGAQTVLRKCYDLADPTLSPKDRVAAALKEFDKTMEGLTKKSSEERIKEAAQSLQSQNSPSPRESDKTATVRQEEARKAYVDSRVERYKKTHNGRAPTSIV